MTSQNLPTDSKDLQQLKSRMPRIGSSTYVVNNSLIGCLRPKRASFDIKLYLQLHNKVTRKSMIEKKFQESIYQFNSTNQSSRKGFQGKRKPENFQCKSHSLREETKPVKTQQQVGNETSDNWRKTQWNDGNRKASEQVSMNQSTVTSRVKPNMMYNLSLYRKGFKQVSTNLKKERMCLTIMESLQRSKRDIHQSRGQSQRKSKMHTTTY